MLRCLLFLGLACGAPGWSAETNTPPLRRSLLVLPFVNESGNAESEHWMGTFRSMLRRQFEDVTALKVVADEPAQAQLRRWRLWPMTTPWSDDQLRLIGEQTQAQRVLCGSLRQTNGQWQAAAQVFVTATGRRSAPLTATAADWFDLRDGLSRLVLKQLGLRLTPEEDKGWGRRFTSSAAALEWFSRGLSAQAQDLPRAMRSFEKAVAADPQFAFAGVCLAGLLYSTGRPTEALAAAREALRQTPDPREAALCHLLLGLALQSEPAKAEAELRTARRLAPHHLRVLQAHAQFLELLGEHQQALECLHQALRLEPDNPKNHALLGAFGAAAGNIAPARQALRTAEGLLEGAPADERLNTAQFLGKGYFALGDYPRAALHYQALLDQATQPALASGQYDWVKARLRQIETRLTPVPIPAVRPRDYTAAELAAAVRKRLSPAEAARVVNPLETTPPMREWAQTLVATAETPMARARRLFETLCQRPPLLLRQARTAHEVYAAWSDPGARFNCQEYAKLYVALARAVGLPAYFTMVEKTSDGTTGYHACAAVFVEGQAWLVDPMFRWFGVVHQQYQLFDDLRLLAAHCGQQVDPALCALACQLDPASALNHANFGIACLVAGRGDDARRELAWLRAQAPGHWMRWHLEGRLAEQADDLPATVESFRQAATLTPDDGDTRLRLGAALFRQSQWLEARRELRAGLLRRHSPELAAPARHLLALLSETLGLEAP